MYQVKLRIKAAKSLKRIDKKYQKRVIVALEELEKDASLGKPLAGKFKGLYSLKVWPFKFYYKLINNNLTIYTISNNLDLINLKLANTSK